MRLHRCLLLVLGIAGSMLALWALQNSIYSVDIPSPVMPVQATHAIQLPIAVPGTTLLAQRLSAYEGPFLEDASNREVVDVAALHLYNAGDQMVHSACITLQMDDSSYVFYGECFPPGETVVVLEIYAKAYRKGTILNCSGWQELLPQVQQEGVTIFDKDNGTLVVTNTTDQALHNLQIYYKSWLSPPDVYMGGITRCITVSQLLPGQTEMRCPDHYATDYSKVVSIIADP